MKRNAGSAHLVLRTVGLAHFLARLRKAKHAQEMKPVMFLMFCPDGNHTNKYA
jgi:hypothetical protein